MYVSVAAGLNSSALVVITPVAEPIAGTVKNRTATIEAATVRAARFNVRIGVPLSLVSVAKRITKTRDAQPGNPGRALPSAAVAVPDHSDREEQRSSRDQLAAHDDAVDVDRGTPVDVVAVDHEGACGAGVHAEPATRAGALSLG